MARGDERREDNTAAGETTFTTNTEVSNNMCNGHHISASVSRCPHQGPPPAMSSSMWSRSNGKRGVIGKNV